MPRKERLFIPGLPQLIYLRGNNGETLFADEEDYRFFLSCLKKASQDYHQALHAFALQEARIHLLLTSPDKTSLSRFMQHVGRCYVPYFNRKYQRTGALLEGRYHSCIVEPSTYFLICQKYVETRPSAVSAHDYPWSSARANAGFEALDFVRPHDTLAGLGRTDDERRVRYRQFLASPLSGSFTSRIEECLQQNCVLGTLQFCRELEGNIHQSVRPRHSGRPRKHYPNRLSHWFRLEQEAQACLTGYAYQEIRLPLIDASAPSDMPVSPSLRSEGTMACLRAIARQDRMHDTARLWYQGPMFRTHHMASQGIEQFHQIGAEAFGHEGIEIELEQLLIQYDLIRQLKLAHLMELHITTLGSEQEIGQYREALKGHFSPFRIVLDEAQRKDLDSSPERLLRTPPPMLAELVAAAPAAASFLSEATRARFDTLTRALEQAGIPFTHTPGLFPDRACYAHTFYEWQTAHLDEHNVVCCGGRYDGLAREVAGYALPAVGFAFMVEPLVQLAETSRAALTGGEHAVDISILADSALTPQAMQLGHRIRDSYPHLAVFNDFSGVRMVSRLARARRRGSRFVIVLRADEPGRIELTDSETRSRILCDAGEVMSRLQRWFN
ncbi:ATP phosphoribosyltransferase regulatory subunit [Paludibacterium paludis]|uniref:Histidine--tRNA ligase n=1 Tax=Paludibacterium paludis TaxID=1225769 RepID=A0A918NY89_9NEIS|nr:ATP phosphoribosyltransferase regulatory subunit [Paludibacterium paludis]GGY05262.1 histidine--tRNA ligase [Paludibacterium paludis]